MRRRDIERNDRWRAAIHEAGHLTVALASGRSGIAWIFPNATDDPLIKTWLGTMSYSRSRSAVIAVAGIVAECIADGDGDAFIIMNHLRNKEIVPSDTDKLGFPTSHERLYKAVDKAVSLLGKHQRFFDWAVRRLVWHKRIYPPEANNRFELAS